MNETEGLLWAYDIDRDGRGRKLQWEDITRPSNAAYRWIHLDLNSEAAARWLRERSGLSSLEADALLAEETRPRSTPIGDGALLLILRGVNHNPGADPEDMVSVRLWADSGRVITVRRRRALACADLETRVEAGRGPRSVGEFVAELADRLVERMAGALGDLDETLDALETDDAATGVQRQSLLEFRRQAILLRRHLSPQRDALARVSSERLSWLGEGERLQLREVLDRTTRYVEDLEAARERAAVMQEELSSRLSEELNQRMYALSIVAGIFLPLSFATGLLGINVAGIPGASVSWAFAAVCAALVLLGIAELILFRRLRWL